MSVMDTSVVWQALRTMFYRFTLECGTVRQTTLFLLVEFCQSYCSYLQDKSSPRSVFKTHIYKKYSWHYIYWKFWFHINLWMTVHLNFRFLWYHLRTAYIRAIYRHTLICTCYPPVGVDVTRVTGSRNIRVCNEYEHLLSGPNEWLSTCVEICWNKSETVFLLRSRKYF